MLELVIFGLGIISGIIIRFMVEENRKIQRLKNPKTYTLDEIEAELGLIAEPRNRLFEEVVVEYPDPDKCAYQEYKGKPYYSIRYREDGQDYLGFGTYKPEVLSQYLKEYFVHPVEPRKGRWIKDRLSSTCGGSYGVYRCSECENSYQDIGYGWNYCPNCGARMEEQA